MPPKNCRDIHWYYQEHTHIRRIFFFRSASWQKKIIMVYCIFLSSVASWKCTNKKTRPVRKLSFNLRRCLGRQERAAARSRFFPDRSIDLSLRLLSCRRRKIPRLCSYQRWECFRHIPEPAVIIDCQALLIHRMSSSLCGWSLSRVPLTRRLVSSVRSFVCYTCCDNSGHTRVNARFPREKLLTMTSASCGAVKFFS